tara:strand:+ start:831 stop:2078 length:1248 start_codon:yes stop_codon:yes gene_type:complete
MNSLPENATIVEVEGTGKYYIKVDRGGVSFFFDPGDKDINQLIADTTGLEDPLAVSQLAKDNTETIDELSFEDQFIDDDFLVFAGDYDSANENWTDILNNVKNITERETWWGNKEFRDEYIRVYELATDDDGVFDKTAFFENLKTNNTIGVALGELETSRDFFNRTIDERLDPYQYGMDLDTYVGAIQSVAISAGVPIEDINSNTELNNSLNLIANNLNNGKYGDPNTKAAVAKATNQVTALVNPAFRKQNGGIYTLNDDIYKASQGMSTVNVKTKHNEVQDLLNEFVPQNMWSQIDVSKEASKLQMNPNYKYELEDKLKDKRFAEYSMYDRNISWSTIVNNKKGSIKAAWGVDVKWNNPVLNDIISMNDSAKEGEYLRGKGMELGIDKVKNDFALASASAYGDGVIKSQNFLEN